MKLFVIWIVVTIFFIQLVVNKRPKEKNTFWSVNVSTFILLALCVCITFGIPIGKITGAGILSCVKEIFSNHLTMSIDSYLLILMFLGIISLGYGYFGLSIIDKLRLESKRYQTLLETILLVSALVFTIQSYIYEINLERVYEEVISEEKWELIPFSLTIKQDVSGTINGGRYKTDGTITTTDYYIYLYINKNGQGDAGYAPVESTTFNFVGEDEFHYVEIIHHSTKIILLNHNDDSTKVISDDYNSWDEYLFYVPESFKTSMWKQ